MKGRTVFIREQRLYHVKNLRKHIEFGDVGDDRYGEILPHPYCDFCEEFFFNDVLFFDHLSKNHLTCHLCGDHHKNIYYDSYDNLDIHFTRTHVVCPYDSCKAKCYVAFKTEDELKTHLDIQHNQGSTAKGKIKANALLGFERKRDDSDDEEDHRKKGKKQPGKDNNFAIKDQEGVDFNFYFSQKYAMIHEKKKRFNQDEDFGQRGRGGRGRGRGERGGRGRSGRGGHRDQ